MSDVTVNQLADVLGMPVTKLLEQFREAGMEFSGGDELVSSQQKIKLLGHLRRAHGKREDPLEAGPRKITLKRRTVSELTVGSGPGKAKTVNVEVRQKKTYVKRSVVQDAAEADPEREEALRLLRESQAQQEAEQAQREEAERKRREAEEREAEAARLAAEEAARLAAEAEAARLMAEKEKEKEREKTKPGAPRKEARKDIEPHHKPRLRDDVYADGRHKHPKDVVVVELDDPVPPVAAPRVELHLRDTARRVKRKPQRQRGADPSRMPERQAFSKPTAPVVREVEIGESITVGELAQKLAVKAGELIKTLMKLGVMATINQSIDHDTAVLAVEELGHVAKKAADTDLENTLKLRTELQGEALPRPPVVTIMGHVDHGKTSLLDYIRRTKVAAGEAGGITQHIGAYHVKTPKGVVCFLDTPGHAAFTQMRARGAKLTDIVVLVVAADDGVMPQTIEAVQHARAAGTPIIVAVNKIDKSDADPERVRQELTKYEVIPEEWGGENIFINVSAKTGAGVEDLLEALALQAEVMELKAVPKGNASGVVIEASLDKGRGPVATVLVQQGTLKRGDSLICGTEYGRVRAMFDESGRAISEAGPSIPAVVLGLSGVPNAGDDFAVLDDEKLARDAAEQRRQKLRDSRLQRQQAVRLEDMFSQKAAEDAQRTLNVVIKADVQGSAEALRDALEKLSTDSLKVNVIASGVGGITESDASLAQASNAILIGFNVRADAAARRIVAEAGLDLHYFSIIYDVIDQVRQAATGLLGTEVREDILGIAQVREVFRSSKFGAIAGCMVIEGVVRRNKPIRVLRDNVVIFEGELESLRRFKDNVDEVRNGMECGIGVKQYKDVKPGDQIECFERIEVQRTL